MFAYERKLILIIKAFYLVPRLVRPEATRKWPIRECSLFMGRGVGWSKRSLPPYLGGSERFYSGSGEEGGGGGGQKSLKVDIISFFFFFF